MGKVCSFFGHRDAVNCPEILIKDCVRELVIKGVHSFWCGGYGNFDACCARVVHGLKKEYPEIELIYILPYLSGHHINGIEMYDGTIYPEGLESVPPRFAIARRNQWMIKNSDVIVAWVDHTWGGAYTACLGAAKQGKKIINLTGMKIEVF